MEWIQSERGGRKLLLGGYMYVKQKDLADGYEGFECELRRNTRQCRAKIKVMGDNQFRDRTEHNHPPNHGRSNATKVKAATKRRATESNERPQQVLMATLCEVTEEGRAALPSLNNMRRNIRRQRQENPNALPIPMTVEDLEIPVDQRLTLGGELFLYHDSGRNDPRRILVFTTERNLQLLSTSESWFADGTFKVVPTIFFQLWTIHATYEGHVVPLVYCLMLNKDQASYARVLAALQEGRAFYPTRIMIDYEFAAKNAFSQAFPNAHVQGCLFHLCQRIHERIKQEGLQVLYNEDEEIRTQARMIGAIAFVPVEDTVEAFEALAGIARAELQPVLNYFEDTYVGRPQRAAGHGRQAARFPPIMWNMFNATLQGEFRTNNHVEGWHRRFQIGVGADHPSFWQFLTCLKREHAMNEVTIGQAQAGMAPPARRRVYQDTNLRLIRLVTNYHGRDIVDFLRGVSHNLH
ncbi:uncharacterized protein LOC115920726 [Strongylocentrotus purpuratus]|uniref:MULE transposase domain-containing protein n=1 Tax=Strongylocentrotus purpuratus TaxID=7668 RepID=A0A7M7N977_STRPU|nr:uncharacterized protein LOC115920726 [Strongylocentrotus purpuratus]